MIIDKLIAKAKKSNSAAQTELYDRYRSVWYSICLRYNKNEHDAMDVLQNALIKIFTKMVQFDSNRGSFKSWSCQVVVNENLMYLRQQSNKFVIEDIDSQIDVPMSQENAEDILSAQELTHMIQTLPVGYRTVFNLNVIEGYPHKEIAEMLNISVGTSKSQLFKAKKMLQQKLEVIF